MSYCINPQCIHPENPENLEFCKTCGLSLWICDRYRIVKPLRLPNAAHPTDIFEVKDCSGSGENWGKLKVMKVLKYSNNPELVRLFQQEARVLIFLRHPGIPKVDPDGYFTILHNNKNKRSPCLVMEKIEGVNLAHWLEKNGAISSELALDWLQQLAEILREIHSHNLIHRDIKPSNIILTPNSKLVLIDFGTVGVGNWGATPVGSMGYAAPEQLNGKAVLQSDFFALGRTFVHLLAGIPPMDFPTQRKTGKLIWHDKVKPKIISELKDLIDELMAPLPLHRPKNARSLANRLKIFRSPSRGSSP